MLQLKLMANVNDLIKKVTKFRDKRDWKQFHSPKDLAISLSIEAAELLEHFRWKNKKEVESYIKGHKKEIEDEYADVLYALLLIANDLNIDPAKALDNKLEKNNKKYPVKKAKGRHEKYTEL